MNIMEVSLRQACRGGPAVCIPETLPHDIWGKDTLFHVTGMNFPRTIQKVKLEGMFDAAGCVQDHIPRLRKGARPSVLVGTTPPCGVEG